MPRGGPASFLALFLLLPAAARADEDELVLMREPTSYTDVVDAFDGDDLFDVNVSLGYHRMRLGGTIRREISDSRAMSGRASTNFDDIADYEHLRHTLEVGLDVGLFHDLAFYARLPVVLSDSRNLRAASADRPATLVNDELCVPDPTTGTCDNLFQVPFDSPTRSGIPYLAFGIAWAPFNQNRDFHLPTWVLMVEGRFATGTEMHACEETDTGTVCRPGFSGPGVSRHTNALRLETRASRRYRYVEPYAGLSFMIEWPKEDNTFTPTGDLSGFMNDLPPRIGEVTFGLTVFPWEHRGRYQRFGIDLRIQGMYVSEGHDFGPLFDALGTSRSRYLTEPNCEGIPRNAEDCAPGSDTLRPVEFFGLTDTQAHGVIGGRLAIEMQAARYVRFTFGAGLFFTTAHLITFADACNPNVDPNPDAMSDPRAGRCVRGIINPHHRPVIDLPGERFQLADILTLDLFAGATATF